ncbi:MAG: GNAT family N-acetyltransferase [Chitinophagaceae bacterium]|nr:GNAT family N-acetyltransferase [Chitinophagaceae bacterium]
MGTPELKRYQPEIVLFAGFDPSGKNITGQLNEVISIGDSFFLFDRFPVLPNNYTIESVVECLQMVCEVPVPASITEEIILLNETHAESMFALVSEVFPGYYLPGTRLLGNYYGIFRDGQLAAIAGERLCMEGLTEISAVVTHPAYSGRRYAQQLVSLLSQQNRQAGIMPFLHTGSNNERAIAIYELLGYQKRRLIPVTKIKRSG